MVVKGLKILRVSEKRKKKRVIKSKGKKKDNIKKIGGDLESQGLGWEIVYNLQSEDIW